ncbi:unnamed protein product [Anisakis simplex]|uniref:Beta-lactamase domain-containing protein n=1 Tax=Anisakis simplex TaxID=6269 RepID=A0A0M3JPI1_ANISI|nr:unnamed protein product [Anisakis simplex]
MNSNTTTNNRNPPTEPRKAPIAQAECSDTDFDTARSICRAISVEKNKSNNASDGHSFYRGTSFMFCSFAKLYSGIRFSNYIGRNG